MTNEEKAKLYNLAKSCSTCMARNDDFGFKCGKSDCTVEHTKNFNWLMEDYKQTEMSKSCVNEAPVEADEPRVNWYTVEVDTLIEVSPDGIDFAKRYFAKYENGTVCCWVNGRTSKTAGDANDTCCWKYARLIEESKNETN